jgi:hypothetical protein
MSLSAPLPATGYNRARLERDYFHRHEHPCRVALPQRHERIDMKATWLTVAELAT